LLSTFCIVLCSLLVSLFLDASFWSWCTMKARQRVTIILQECTEFRRIKKIGNIWIGIPWFSQQFCDICQVSMLWFQMWRNTLSLSSMSIVVDDEPFFSHSLLFSHSVQAVHRWNLFLIQVAVTGDVNRMLIRSLEIHCVGCHC
jgi:hypothetical protein